MFEASGAPLHVPVQDAEAGGHRHVFEQAAAEVAVEGGDVVGEVGLEDVEAAVEVEVPHRHAHARLGGAELAVGDAARHGHVAERAVVLVPVEDRGGGVAGHVQVGPAVAVEVGGCWPSSVASRDLRHAGSPRRLEAPVARGCGRARFVSKGRPLGPQFTGTPFHRQLAPWPGSAAVARSRLRGSSPRTGRAGRPGRSRGSCTGAPARALGVASPAFSVTLRTPVAAVAVEDVPAEVGDEQVAGAPVVVVVAHAYRGSEAGAAQSPPPR